MLIVTTSCDAGVQADLWCDSCDEAFALPADSLPVLRTVWAAAMARGWSGRPATSGLRHYCPRCTPVREGRSPAR